MKAYPNELSNILHPLEEEGDDNEPGIVPQFLDHEVAPLFPLGIIAAGLDGPVELKCLIEVIGLTRPQVVVVVELSNPTRNLPNLPSLEGVLGVEDGAVLLLEFPEARVDVKGTPEVVLPLFVPVWRQVPADPDQSSPNSNFPCSK